MEFKKYNSIDNAYRTKTVQKIQMEFPEEEFVVQEKAHGANFAFYLSQEGILPAKRSGFIVGDEVFYNHLQVLKENMQALQYLYDFISKTSDVEEIVIHGELCGGNYPHPKITPAEKQTQVQKGVYYYPRNMFYAFDMKFDGKFLPIDATNALLDQFGIFRAKILCRGTLEECLEYSNEYQTTIPEILGLPEIKDNICEGNVIKPVMPLFFENGNRVILKNKNERFSEKSKKKPKKIVEIPEHIAKFQQEAQTFIVENRLRNVLSKIGEVTHKDFGKMLGLFSVDVLEDFAKDNEEYTELDKKDQKFVKSFVNTKCAEMIRKNLANICDGEF